MTVSVPVEIPQSMVYETLRTMRELAEYWNEELPLRLHSRELNNGGTPQWHHDFALWLGGANQFDDRRWRDRPEPRVKTTRAFRKLRKVAPREYEVLYRTAILGIPFSETVTWLNDRAIKNNKPDRYGIEEALLLLISGVDKVATWFSV